ncbi:helix-turn-helix domain-containing protein [Deinococcus yunweiensis]|uniref:helix-turn-helix domain-containing protein n=1 Tax=Deinococcus yunweiensis TaxID=367282 RepID=UPI00398F0C8B
MPKTKRAPSAARRLFGERLRAERRAKGLTLEDVGEAADIAWNYVAQVERGERNIGIDNMAALADAVGVALPDLLRRMSEPLPR